MASSQVCVLLSQPLLCSFRHCGRRRKNLVAWGSVAYSSIGSRVKQSQLPGSPLTSSPAEHLWHPRVGHSVNELKAMERRDWRGYHTLHVPDAAVLGTVNGGKGSGCYGTLCIPESAVLKGRSYHTCSQLCLPDKKAKIELAVDTVKEKKKAAPKTTDVVEAKPSLARRAWDMVLHSYHGFRLLALDTRVAARLLWKTMKGNSLTRREQKQFRRTAGDIFRVVPFSVFIIIPFMEFLLPVYLWFFPNALPSTFQSSSAKEVKKKQQLKVKMQMARFLQETIEDMAVASKRPNKTESVAEFARFFEKIRVSGEQATTEELVKFSKLFEDELTLDNLSRPQLIALCKLLLLQPIGTNNFLRFQLRMKLRQLQADDLLIKKEKVESLTEAELQSASQARGMMALGVPADRLKSQLEQWLDLHLVKKIPASLLLLSRALYLPEGTPTGDALQATLSTLPESIVEEAEVLVADTSGESVANKRRLDLIRQQEQLIQKEAEEKEVEKKELKAQQPTPEEMVDTAPIISSSLTPPLEQAEPAAEGTEVSISVEELKELNEVVQSLKTDQDRTALEELKEDREEYIEDVADLAVECKDEIQESKGSARLGRRVDSMISKIDNALQSLETEDNVTLDEMREERSDVISTVKLEEALEALKGLSGEAKTRSIVAVLDEDHDGNINLDEIAEVIESLALEDTDIKPQHIEQIKELIKKEVVLEEDAQDTISGQGQ